MTRTSDRPRQTKETARKGKKIRELRSQGIGWAEICRELGILKENGDPDTGLAHRIAYDDYEPKGQELRDRLGLRKMCLSCMRGFRSVSKRISALPPWRAWWNRLKPAERDRWIRSNYEKENK